jgi:uncharacterized LabA/DUF88 family protein
MKQFKEKDFHIFIDSENFNPYLIKSILSEISGWGNISSIKAFGNFNLSCMSPYEKVLKDEAIEKIALSPISKLKNGADIALTVEAMKVLDTKTNSTLVFLTSDSDYSYLIKELVNNKIEVIGIGEEKTNKKFQIVFDTFIFAEIFAENYYSKKKVERRANTLHDEKLINKLCEAIANRRDTAGYANVSSIGCYLKENYSDFQVLNYGFKKITHLLKSFDIFDVKQKEKLAFVSIKEVSNKSKEYKYEN